MSKAEEIEMGKRRKALDKDVASLVEKYLRKMEWGTYPSLTKQGYGR